MKRGTTRDTAKARTELQRKREAIQNGRAFDAAFKTESAALLDHIYQTFQPGERGDLKMMVQEGGEILRAIAYEKKSSQTLGWDSDEKEEDRFLEFEKQEFNHLYMDAAALDIVSIAKRVHLAEPLVRFEVRVLEAVIDWAEHNPQNFSWLDILKQEVEDRRAGKDTFELPKLPEPARKKPGPKGPRKPKQAVVTESPLPFVIPANFEL